jgi:hypothetical protein
MCGPYVTPSGERRKSYKIIGQPQEKRQLGTPNRRGEDNIRIDFTEIECVVWTGFNWLRTGL